MRPGPRLELRDQGSQDVGQAPLAELHPHALTAAEAAEAAGAQGKFWPMHDLLFENQQHLKASHLRAYALDGAGPDLPEYPEDAGTDADGNPAIRP